jgi:hypothetical protein
MTGNRVEYVLISTYTSYTKSETTVPDVEVGFIPAKSNDKGCFYTDLVLQVFNRQSSIVNRGIKYG